MNKLIPRMWRFEQIAPNIWICYAPRTAIRGIGATKSRAMIDAKRILDDYNASPKKEVRPHVWTVHETQNP